MANMLNDYFSSVFNSPTEAVHITTNDTDTNNEIGSTSATSEQSLHNLEITTKEVLKVLKDMKTNKSPGPDSIYPRVLKETKSESVDALKTVYNLSLRQGCVPVDWKATNVTPVFQKRRQKYTRELQGY